MDELVDLFEVWCGYGWVGQDQWEWQVFVFFVQQNVEQVQDFFGGIYVIGEYDDVVIDLYECFEMFFDVWYDYQVVYDWVG